MNIKDFEILGHAQKSQVSVAPLFLSASYFQA